MAWVTLWAGDLDVAESYARDAIRLAPEGVYIGEYGLIDTAHENVIMVTD